MTSMPLRLPRHLLNGRDSSEPPSVPGTEKPNAGTAAASGAVYLMENMLPVSGHRSAVSRRPPRMMTSSTSSMRSTLSVLRRRLRRRRSSGCFGAAPLPFVLRRPPRCAFLRQLHVQFLCHLHIRWSNRICDGELDSSRLCTRIVSRKGLSWLSKTNNLRNCAENTDGERHLRGDILSSL